MHHPDHAVAPGFGRAGVQPHLAQHVAEDPADACAQHVHVVGHRILAERHSPVQQRPADDEAIQLRLGLDEREVRLDSGLQDRARLALVLHRAGDRVGERAGDAAANGEIEVCLVGEVAVDHRLAGPRLRGDLLHAHTGAMAADGRDRRCDELVSSCVPVRLPAQSPAVGGTLGPFSAGSTRGHS